jgi:hypothetical protein
VAEAVVPNLIAGGVSLRDQCRMRSGAGALDKEGRMRPVAAQDGQYLRSPNGVGPIIESQRNRTRPKPGAGDEHRVWARGRHQHDYGRPGEQDNGDDEGAQDRPLHAATAPARRVRKNRSVVSRGYSGCGELPMRARYHYPEVL